MGVILYSLFWLELCDLGKLKRPKWVLEERQKQGCGVGRMGWGLGG